MHIKQSNINSNMNKIIAYSDYWFKLEDRIVQKNIVISKDRIDEDFLTDNFQDFTLKHLRKLISWQPEIILIGSGKSSNFPNKQWQDYTNNRDIGLEVMDTGAACRSYNLLVDDNRNVIACLFLTNND